MKFPEPIRCLIADIRGKPAGSAPAEVYADVRRREARGPGDLVRTASERNVRPREIYSAQESPDPFRYGDTPARPSRMPIVTFLAIAPYKAVMMDDFFLQTIAPNHTAATLHGPAGTFGERANIDKPAAEAYGNLVLLKAGDPYAGLRASS